MRTKPTIDAAYLRAALARAGVDAPFDSIETSTFSDGRSGAVVTGIRAGEHRFVVKSITDDEGFRSGLSTHRGGEATLWTSGATKDLPAPLTWPVLDASRHEAERQWWLLMRDVSEGIVPRGGFDPDKLHRLLGGVARLHARYWADDRALDAIPLLPPAAVARLFAEPVGVAARGEKPQNEAVRWMVEDFVLGRFVPLFLDSLDPRDADFYMSFVSDRESWLAALARHEPTFLHGDLRRANISYLPDGTVCLLDWERAMRGHASIDLAWHWFLQFWAYPPSVQCDSDGYRAAYLDRLEDALGRRVDRASFDAAWGLSWLKVLSEVGWLLADPLDGPSPSPGDVARVKDTGRRAIELARRAMDRV